jgi:hypothetical protein
VYFGWSVFLLASWFPNCVNNFVRELIRGFPCASVGESILFRLGERDLWLMRSSSI